MAIGTQTQGPLVAGLAATPAVTSPGNVITPDAVTALVDSFHKGVITGNDLVDHIGMVAQAKKRTALQEMGEYVSPEAIQARKSALGAQTAQNQLVQHMATTKSDLVEPEVQSQLADLRQKEGMRNQTDAVTAWTQYGNPPLYLVDKDGNPTKQFDYEAMAEGGIPYVRAQKQFAFASEMLKGQWVETVDPKTKQPRMVFMNSHGEDVTPVPGNPTFDNYNEARKEAQDTLFHANPKKPTPRVVGSPGARQIQDAGMAPMITGSESLVAPSAAAPAAPPPVVGVPPVPGVAAAPENYMPMQGIAKGPANTIWDEAKTAEELGKSPVYANWSNTRTQIPNFVSAANAINAIPTKQQMGTNMNPLDIALAESLIKMYDPQGVIREFKWDKFQDNQPLLERLKAAQQSILRTGQFAPSVRQDLIKLGKETIQARELGVKPVLALAARRASGNPTTQLENIMDAQDLDLLKNNKSSVDSIIPPVDATGIQSSTAAPAAASNARTFQTGPFAGKTLYADSHGVYWPTAAQAVQHSQ